MKFDKEDLADKFTVAVQTKLLCTTPDMATWFNYHRLLEPLGDIPPAEAEAKCYRQLSKQAMSPDSQRMGSQFSRAIQQAKTPRYVQLIFTMLLFGIF